MSSTTKMDRSTLRWLMVGASALAVALAGVGVLVFISLKAPGLTREAFFPIAFALGICAAAVLFGAMKSYARYSGQIHFGTLKLGGPAVVFFAVILAAYLFAPPAKWLDVDVYLKRPDGTLINRGKVTLRNARGCNSTASIGEDKRAIFKRLAVFCGGDVTVDTEVDDFEPATRDYTLSESDGALCAPC